MKFKLIYVMTCAIIIIVSISCSKDSSSPTEIDFTNDEWIDNFDYILMVESDDYSPIDLESREFVETSELIINNFVINTTNWEPSGDEGGDWLNWYCDFDSDDIPDSLDLSPSSVLDISLTINGTNNSGTITIPDELTADFPEFDITQDYYVSWEINTNPNIQMLWFGCANNNWYDVVFGNYQLTASKRDYTIQKSLYSDFVETGVEWFEIGIGAINYIDLDKCLYLVGTGDSYEEGDSKRISKKIKYQNILNQILKNR